MVTEKWRYIFLILCFYICTDLRVTVEFLNFTHLLCTTTGGIVSSISWTRNGVPIVNDTFLFTFFNPTVDRLTVTSKLVIFSNIQRQYLGLFSCNVIDGNGRSTSGSLHIRGVQ